jgi:predicted Zn-ribbon and HTH transcriptional regulator
MNCSRGPVLVKVEGEKSRRPCGLKAGAGGKEIRYTLPMNRKFDGTRDGLRPPAEALDTVRHLIMTELEEGPLSARDISGLVGIPEKEVAGHLEHIRQSLHRTGGRLKVQPAECIKCGFVFDKRDRLTRPSRCPVCKSESIHAPLFSLSRL